MQTWAVWEGLDWNCIASNILRHTGSSPKIPERILISAEKSYGDVLRRAKPVIERLAEEHRGESIAVVAHTS